MKTWSVGESESQIDKYLFVKGNLADGVILMFCPNSVILISVGSSTGSILTGRVIRRGGV